MSFTKDFVHARYLRQQYIEGAGLAQDSDVLNLMLRGDDHPARQYEAEFRCPGLVKRDGQVVEHHRHRVVISFGDAHLEHVDVSRLVTWLEPLPIFHPNIRPPFICLGHIQPGTPLVDLLYQIYEIITYQKVTMREDDALNPEACKWARNNLQRFPLDLRPLRRRALKAEA